MSLSRYSEIYLENEIRRLRAQRDALLAALKGMLNAWEKEDEESLYDATLEARAAIKLAEGKP